MHTHITTSDGTQLYVTTSGPATPDAVATVVLLHGLCMTSASWARTVAGLRRHQPQLRVVTVDIRGHGRSAIGPAGSHNLSTLADDLHEVLDAAAPCGPLILAGHSMGAMAVLAHLRLHPSTLSRLRGLSLIATASSELPQHGGIARFLPLSAVAPTLAAYSPSTLERGWDVLRQAFTPFLGARGCTRPAAIALAGYLASLRALDEDHTLASVSHIPTTVMCGTHDHVTPPYHAHHIHALTPQARLVQVSRAGHQLPLTHPSQIAAELSRLVDVSLGRSSFEPTAAPLAYGTSAAS